MNLKKFYESHKITIKYGFYYFLIFSLIIAILLLIGCKKPEPDTIVIEKPIAIKFPPPIIPKLDPLPISALQDNSSPRDIMKAYVETVYIQKYYINTLIQILDDYK